MDVCFHRDGGCSPHDGSFQPDRVLRHIHPAKFGSRDLRPRRARTLRGRAAHRARIARHRLELLVIDSEAVLDPVIIVGNRDVRPTPRQADEINVDALSGVGQVPHFEHEIPGPKLEPRHLAIHA